VERNAKLAAALQSRAETIYQQILQDFDSLTGLERTLAQHAAQCLAYAERTFNVDTKARMLGAGNRTLDKLRKTIEQRRANAPLPTLQELGL
jgi:hypothetical protein